MIQHYDGQALYGADGDRLGTIERTFVDDKGLVHYVAVKMGSLFSKHRLVPMDRAESRDGGLQVPYSRDLVADGPSVDVGEALGPDAIEKIRAYYRAGDREPEEDETSHADDNDGVKGRLAEVGSDLKSAVGGILHGDHGDSADASTEKTAGDGQEASSTGGRRAGV